jgi:predicted ATP-dependent endonuclease of OLD family
MKITIENFGPLKFFELDLTKNLNMIYGKNSVGKSYAVDAIYNFLNNILNKSIISEFGPFDFRVPPYGFIEETLPNSFDKDNLIELFKEEDSANISLKLESYIENFFTINILPNLKNSLENNFPSNRYLKNEFNHENFRLLLTTTDFTISFASNNKGKIVSRIYLNFPINISFDNGNINVEYTINYQKRGLTTILFRDINPKDKESEYKQVRDLVEDIIDDVTSKIFTSIKTRLRNIYFLPASRSGLYIGFNSFSTTIAELSKIRLQTKRKIELPNFSDQVANYLIDISSIKSIHNVTLLNISRSIEENILGGTVLFDQESNKLKFQPENTQINLDLTETSSMVSEIAPLVSYLKFIIEDFQKIEELARRKVSDMSQEMITERLNRLKILLIIEEPEAHLHPEVQDKLMEQLIELTKYNIQLIITSHSNYMFNKLSNLILEEKISYKDIGIYHLVMTEEGSIDKKDMVVSKEGITDENFYITSERQYDERVELFNKLNKE